MLPSVPGAAPQGLKDCGSLVAAAATQRGQKQQKHPHLSPEEVPSQRATSRCSSASGLHEPPSGDGRATDENPLGAGSCAILCERRQQPEQQPLQGALEGIGGLWTQQSPGTLNFAAEPDEGIANCANGQSVSSVAAGGAAAPEYDVDCCKREEQQQLGHLEDEDLYYFGEEKSPIENRGEEEATPVVAWGRCVSSDDWRRSSSGCSDDVSSDGGNSERAGRLSIDSACNHWARLLREEKTDMTVSDLWIIEAVRYMELVVEASGDSNTEASPPSTVTYSDRRKFRAPSAISHRSQQLVAALTPQEIAGARRPRFKTVAGDFAVSRAAAEKATTEHVHELVLKLYKRLHEIARQIDPDQCGCSSCHFGGRQRLRECLSSDTLDGRGTSSSNSSRGSDKNSMFCACCAFGTPLGIGAALCHLYRENPARFSLLVHDSVLLALLPLQPHAAAALADALFQRPSPLIQMLTDGSASQLLEAAAEETAAEVVAAGAASHCSLSRREQPHEASAAEVAFANVGKRYNNLTSSNKVSRHRHSWPECVRRPRSRDLQESYSCCGATLCKHKRAAAKRFLERQQQMLRRQMQHRMLQCHMRHQQAIIPLHQIQQMQEEPSAASAKDAKADPARYRKAEVLEASAEVPPAEAAAKTAASPPAAVDISPSRGGPENSTKAAFGSGSAVYQDSSLGNCPSCIEKQLRLFDSGAEPQLSLGQYVTRLQRLAFATEHELLMALLLLTHAQQRQHQLRISTKNAHRLLLAALVLVSKVVRDDNTPLALWAVVGGVPPRELASLEMTLLELVGHRISFSLPEFSAAYCVARALSHMQQQQGEQGMQQLQQNISCGRARSAQEGDEGDKPVAIGAEEEENAGNKSAIRILAEPELSNNSNSDPPSPTIKLCSKEGSPKETLLPRGFTYAPLKTNPILRRLVQLQDGCELAQ